MPGPVGGGRHGGGGGSFGGGARGGGFSSGGSFHRPAGGGFHTPHHGGFGHRPTGGGHRPYRSGSGCLGPFVIIAAIIIFFGIFVTFIGNIAVFSIDSIFSFRRPVVEYNYSLEPSSLQVDVDWSEDILSITPSIGMRTKLDESLCTPVDVWFEDGADLLTYASEEMQVEKALSYFYDKTGVQPFLLILEHIAGDYYPDWYAVEEYLYDRYIELFGADEGHYIFLYFAYNDGSYDLFYIPGLDAMTVVDENASEILMDHIEQYYYTAGSYAQMFADAFVQTADTIMGSASVQEPDSETISEGEMTTQPVSEAPQTAPPATTEASRPPTETVSQVGTEPTQEPSEKSFGDMSVKEIAWVCFGVVAVVVLFVLVLRQRKRKMEELERMT